MKVDKNTSTTTTKEFKFGLFTFEHLHTCAFTLLTWCENVTMPLTCLLYTYWDIATKIGQDVVLKINTSIVL